MKLGGGAMDLKTKEIMNVTKVFHIKALRELTDEVINKRI
jgi:hypothetical protein